MNMGESDLGLSAGAPRTPLPVSPQLVLPTGDAEVFDDGHLLAFDHEWVVAVGLSNTAFLVVRNRYPQFVDAHRLRELDGYLKACGCDLWPTDFRCPFAWRSHSNFAAIRRLWAHRFFDEGAQRFWPPSLPKNPRLAMSLFDIATDGSKFWHAVAAVATALFAAGQAPEPELRDKLMRLSRQWERGWNALLSTAEDDDLAFCEGWVRQCERAWARVACEYLVPQGYQMRAASLAKLL